MSNITLSISDKTGKLFFSYVKIRDWIQKYNPPGTKFFFVFENVASMTKETRDEISL